MLLQISRDKMTEGFWHALLSSYNPPPGGSIHPLSVNGDHTRIWMTWAVFVWFCTIQSVVKNFVSIVIVVNSAIVLYLFAFRVIQSNLCEMTLLLFKINPMLKKVWQLGVSCSRWKPLQFHTISQGKLLKINEVSRHEERQCLSKVLFCSSVRLLLWCNDSI